ncbi:MAG: glycosyltransferase involved in cell wall biosynthesis [Verrucomicrobiales bacterium]|jgi:glycosyltransferase involved in cell wall biosynthesis
MNDPYLSILLPVYNEVENIRAVVEEILATELGSSFEIIAVDDASTDGTVEELEKLAAEYPNLRVVLFRANRGQTAAFDAGFREARGEIIVTMDSDGQNDPADIPKMVAMLDEGYDCIAGWRKDRKDGYFLRTFPSKIANGFIRLVTRTKVHDLGCSLRVYRVAIAKELRLYGEMHRFIAVLCEDIGAKVGECIVNHRPRAAGTSKYNLNRTFKVLLDLLTVWFMTRFRTKPIYIFGGTGLLSMLSSMGVAAFVLLQRFFGESHFGHEGPMYVHKNPLFTVAVILFLTGVILISMGLLAEILIRVYYEIQGVRPYSTVRKINFDEKEDKK